MGDQARRIANLSPEKLRALLQQVKGKEGRPKDVIKRRGRETDAFPLSYAQQRLWFLHQLDPTNPSYNISINLRLTGPLDAGALGRSLDEIIRRHEVLRTRFEMRGGAPVQVVSPHEVRGVPLIDLRRLPEGARPAEAVRLATAEARRPFDLAAGPAMRTLLLRVGEAEHVLVVCKHHIVSDARSAAVFVGELAKLYGAFSAGGPSPLGETPIQYVDFAAWQREELEGAALERHLDYWKRQLADVGVLELPADRPRPPVISLRGAQYGAAFPKELTASLKALADGERATLFMALLAAFHVLLHRYTGRRDISVGTPIAGRNWRETEDLIGCFINVLVMRADLGGDPTFRELLRKVRETALEAYRHQDCPFEKLVVELQPERSLSLTPLFQAGFQLKTLRPEPAGNLPLKIEPLEIERGRAQNDLSLEMGDGANGLVASAEYSTDLFDEDRIARMMGHFNVLLHDIVANPDRRVSELKLLTDAERLLLLEDFNATDERYPDAFIHRLFERQAALTPEAVAVEFEGERVSYRDLDERANRLAHLLAGRGVTADSIVGVMMERSTEMVVALLGVLKAGGAYLPLDPELPDERLGFMLDDLRPRALVTTRRWRERAEKAAAHGGDSGGWGGPPVVCLDDCAAELSRQTAAPPAPRLAADNLAYVIYTSGSTGQPKAAANTHGAITNRLLWMQEAMRLGPEDAVAQKTPFSFDVSVWEFFWPLMTGARLVVARPGGHRDPQYLAELIVSRGVTTAHFVPSMLAAFVEGGAAARCLGLRRVVCSGEALSPALAERLHGELPGARLYNLYGPTEAAVDVTWRVCEPGAGVMTIGRPIANTRLYALDGRMNPAPVGVAGELYIGGAGLARGYANRPALTAERFVPDPFGREAGGRLYRTGDVGRFTPGGEIEYLGRADGQVKVRGVRVEPGEIEHALGLHPQVGAAAVTLYEPRPGDRRLVAYVAADSGQRPSVESLREHLRARLPEYLVPSLIIFVDKLPLTPSGKVDRRALPAPDAARPDLEAAPVLPQTEMEQRVAAVWREALGAESVGVNDNFFDLGGHSLLLAQVHNRLQAEVEPAPTMVELFKYPTVRALAAFLTRGPTPRAGEESGNQPAEGLAAAHAARAGAACGDIAVVGMAGRFPGAKNVEQFWDNVREGRETISFFSDEQMIAAGVSEAALRDPNFVKARGALEEIDLFDAAFFGFNPREAEVMDPQHRLFLECAWEALEDAGTDPSSYAGRVGVYAGAGLNTSTYVLNLMENPELIESVGRLAAAIGNDKDFLATRVSYKLNLTGPSFSVQTACSTSLVAVHQARQSLLNGECEMALAGGVSISARQIAGYMYQEGGTASPDGRCRAFDASARGTIFSSGVGVVALKRLEDALADGNTIHAVIKGSAVNNDGSLKVGFTAPSVEGQARVIRDALGKAGVGPESISYVEAHGTGTVLGDPIEVAALTKAFGAAGGGKQYCALGSVKTNIGHTDAAAGVAGLIKTVLALKHRVLPPSLHYRSPNPKIDFASSPFFVNTELTEWRSDGAPRRAGVSSFGIGGTNAHVVVEEAPASASESPAEPARTHQLLVVSARTEESLRAAAGRLAARLERRPQDALADVAHTLGVGRKAFEWRLAVVCGDSAEAAAALRDANSAEVMTGAQERSDVPVTFMFPGGGSQYPNMGLDLYRAEPEFRRAVDLCCDLLAPSADYDLRDYLYPAEGRTEEAAEQLRRTAVALPALFVTEYALAKLWMSWGVRPRLMIGHSLGEYVAACLAGVFSIEDALALVAARGRLMGRLPSGAMLGVSLPEEELRALLGSSVSVAAVNGPSSCVVSGEAEAVGDAERILIERGAEVRRIHIDVAAHSEVVESILDEFTDIVAGLSLSPPTIPYVSNVTGTWVTAGQAIDPRYWAKHLRQTVRFGAGLQELFRGPDQILLEVGPGQTLSSLARLHPEKPAAQAIVSSLRHSHEKQSDSAFVLRSLGQLWLAGADVNWRGLYAHERRRLVGLPTYPFERKRYWIEPSKSARASDGRATPRRTQDISDWFYIPAWTRTMLPEASASEGGGVGSRWLVFADGGDLGAEVAEGLEREGKSVFTVLAADEYGGAAAGGVFRVNPARPEDYAKLLAEAADENLEGIVHLWSLSEGGGAESGADFFRRCQRVGYYSLLFLAKALAGRRARGRVRLVVVGENGLGVHGDESPAPERAPLVGACKVLPQEHQNVACRYVDVKAAAGAASRARLAEQLLSEVASDAPDAVVAYRGRQRLVQTFRRAPLEAGARPVRRLRPGGVYLITGGLGRVGLTLAESFARRERVKLVLTGRSGFPPRAAWAGWLEEHGEDDAVSRKIMRLRAVEESGSEVMTAAADVADEARMRAVLDEAVARFGELAGVVHAAGVTKGASILQPITAIGEEESETQFRPKVHGLYTLEKILRGRRPDFCVLMSSNASVLGGLGLFAYSAANSFVDSFALARGQDGGFPWISTNWDVWLDEERGPAQARQPGLDEYSMSPSESAEAFGRVVSGATVEQVIVSAGDLSARVKLWTRQEPEGEPDAPAPAAESSHTRPLLRNAYVPPATETERRVAGAWQSLLGIGEVGVNDNFFELGGHSLLATRLVSRLREGFDVEVPIASVFEGPTVARLAKVVEELLAEQARGDESAAAKAPALVPLSREKYRTPRPGAANAANAEKNSSGPPPRS